MLAGAFALGAAVGSFANVAIHRLPRGESLVRPRSRCPACGTTIPAWANVPLLAWLALRGRCHHCRAAISLRYPLVELATALLFVALYLQWGPNLRLLASWVVGAALIVAAFIDGEHKIIPDEITLPLVPFGLAMAWLAPPPGLLDSLLGAGVVFAMLWTVSWAFERWRGEIGLGMGDVKLLAGLGAFLGLQPVLGVLLLGSLLGIAQWLVLLPFGASRRTQIPFGPALAGAGIVHLYAPGLVSAWVTLG
jgi:leader peptidase (prepilin peptidase)/N-methyltransferase